MTAREEDIGSGGHYPTFSPSNLPPHLVASPPHELLDLFLLTYLWVSHELGMASKDALLQRDCSPRSKQAAPYFF